MPSKNIFYKKIPPLEPNSTAGAGTPRVNAVTLFVNALNGGIARKKDHETYGGETGRTLRVVEILSCETRAHLWEKVR